MGKGFRRIPKDPSKQPRSLESIKRQTPLNTVVSQLLTEAREAYDLADSSQQVALSQIQKLCKDHSTTPLLFRTQAEILEKCYHNATSENKRRRYLEEAKRMIRYAYELSHKRNMAFLTYLGLLMVESANDASGYIEAIDIFNEAYLISNPIDPLGSVILSEDETADFTGFFPTYEERVENARSNIVNSLGFCVLNLKRLDCNPSTIQEKVQELGVKNEDKVKLYWISLNNESKDKFVQVKNVTSYLISSKKYLANLVLSQALSYYEAYGKWEFWICCSCDKTFPNPTQHFLHVTNTHLKELSSELKTFFPPLSVNGNDWILVIKTMAWKPVNISAAIPILKEKWKLLSSARRRSSNVGDNKIVNKNHSTPESSSQETPIEGSTFELLRYDVNPWAKTEIFKWKWPFVKDAKRASLLVAILEILKKLLSEKLFLAAHMNILVQRSMSKLDAPLDGLARDLGLEQTHYPLCLLRAPQLQEILKLLQEMFDFTIKNFKQQSFLEETLSCSMKAFKINGAISLSTESLYLTLDDRSFNNESTSGNSSVKDDDAPAPEEHVVSNESTSGNSSVKDDDAPAPEERVVSNESTSGNSSVKDDDASSSNKHVSINEPTSGNSTMEDDTSEENSIPPWVEGMVSWIYSDHSSDEFLKKWRYLMDERKYRGEEELDAYRGLFTESLRKVNDCQEGLSENVIPTDVSHREVRKDMDFASQKPQVDSFIEAMIQKESESNDSELTEIDKLTLEVAMNMHQMETTLNCFAAYDYQPIVLSILKPYLQEYAEGIVDTTKKPDGAAVTFVADQNVADCGTEGPEDETKMQNPNALLDSQADRNVADCDTKDPVGEQKC